MGRNKALDDEMFNCGQEHEKKLVSNHYDGHEKEIYDFLVARCFNGTIYRSTHMEVYQLIKDTFGYPIPVEEK